MFKKFARQQRLLPLAGLALIYATGAHAETTPYKYIALLNGDCQGVSINDHPLNGLCGQVLMNTLYMDGRTSFGFILNNKAVISFSGTQDTQPDPQHYHMEVNRVAIIAGENQVQPLEASGACDVLGDITKSATINCQARTAANDTYQLRFRTTSPPDVAYGKQSFTAPVAGHPKIMPISASQVQVPSVAQDKARTVWWT